MGRFFNDESPDFRMCENGNTEGMVYFLLNDCLKLKHKAIDRACETHKVPSIIQDMARGIDDPWKRVMAISNACVAGGHSVSLNGNTVHKEFYWKVYPILFEMVCLEFFMGLKHTPWEEGNHYDATVWDKDNQLSILVDFKCKHRNAEPRKTYDVTIPKNNLGGNTEVIFCFGQMKQAYDKDMSSSSLNEGYILGIQSKDVFVNPCSGAQDISKNEEGTNGAKFGYSSVLSQVNKLWKWDSLKEARGFFPSEYYIWRFGKSRR